MKSAVIRITNELVQAIGITNAYRGNHYYAHADGEYRIIWIFDKPIEALIDKSVTIKLSTCYGSRKLTLPQYIGKHHLKVKMVPISEMRRECESISFDQVLRAAPRNGALGRKPSIKNPILIKAAVPDELVGLFKTAGDGNISAGVGVAGELLQREIQSKKEEHSNCVRGPIEGSIHSTGDITYLFNEHSMDGGFTETEAHRMADLLSERGYPVTYGYPANTTDRLVEGVADLLATIGQEGS